MYVSTLIFAIVTLSVNVVAFSMLNCENVVCVSYASKNLDWWTLKQISMFLNKTHLSQTKY